MNPLELLGSEQMVKFLDKLKNRGFNYILLDSPPVLPFSDAGVLSHYSDGAIMVVRAGRTHAYDVRRAVRFLQHTKVRMLGFILAGVDHVMSQSYSDYYQAKSDET